MTDFFYMNSASQDGAGMHLKSGTWGGSSLRTLWEGRKDTGRFPINISPWREEEAQAKRREVRMTVAQRTIPTDFIEPDGGDWQSPFYVSKRVIEAIEKAELKAWSAIAAGFEVTNRNGEFLRKEAFFRIIPLGEAPACTVENWREIRNGNQLTGYEKHADQSKEARSRQDPDRVVARLIPMLETWDGNDFMFEPGGATFGGSFLCSRKVMELAHREQWTNAAFQPLDLIGRNFTDFRLRCWPPEKWYPKWHPSFDPALHQDEGQVCSGEADRSKTRAELREKYPAWECIEDFETFEEVLAYVKRHAAVLGRAPMEDAAVTAWGGAVETREKAKQILEHIPTGTAEDGFLLMLLMEIYVGSENESAWYRSLSSGRQKKIRQILEAPPDEFIAELTHGRYLSGADARRSAVRNLGLDMVIKDRPDFDD